MSYLNRKIYVIIIENEGVKVMKKSAYYFGLDILRVMACVSIFLYHLNILPGGYLSVCTFLVLSGYLSFKSAYNKENFSIWQYYKNRFWKLYLPLILVVFGTVGVSGIISSVQWLNLKPEVLSILFGYNNFWQLNVNLDYFARFVNSPFIHLWYIALLLQFEIVFPIFYKLLNKLKQKIGNFGPFVIVLILFIASFVYYVISCKTNLMTAYYHTFSRIFSILFGLLIAYCECIWNKDWHVKNEVLQKLVIVFYFLILIGLCLFIDASVKYMAWIMLLVTIVSGRVIVYLKNINVKKMSLIQKGVKVLATLTYTIYLWQYPVIYVFQNYTLNYWVKLGSEVLVVLLLSLGTKYLFRKSTKKRNIIYYCIVSGVVCFGLYGVYIFVTYPDYSKEMKALEKQMNENQLLIEENQKNYKVKVAEENQKWQDILKNLENGEKEIAQMVTNLSIVGIGDSVMLGAVNNLYKEFPNSYFDAKVSRTAYEADKILNDLISKNLLGDVVIFNLGTNGDCSFDCKKNILKLCGDREIFWVNTVNYPNINERLEQLAAEYTNLHVIDWYNVSLGHDEYFVADKIHLTSKGREEYTKTIYDSLYTVYLQKYNDNKKQIIQEHEDQIKNKVSFYGNTLLLNAYPDIKEKFSDAKFVMEKDFNYKKLNKMLQTELNENTITKKIVLLMDKNTLTSEQYNNILALCRDSQVFIVDISDQNITLKYDNGTILHFGQELKNKKEDYMQIGNTTLSNEGNKALSQFLLDNIT